MVISGKELAAKLKAEMAEQVKTFPEKYGRVPHLVVILVGNDPGSQTYVRNKEKACDVVGLAIDILAQHGDRAAVIGKVTDKPGVEILPF